MSENLTKQEQTEVELKRVLGIVDIVISSLQTVLFPTKEGLDMAGAEGNVISKASTILSGVGMLVTLTNTINKYVKWNWMAKWIVLPVWIAASALVIANFALWVMGSKLTGKLIDKGSDYVVPVIQFLYAIYLIDDLKDKKHGRTIVSDIGNIVYNITAPFSMPFLKKNKFYVIVIVVRTAALWTGLVPRILELAEHGHDLDDTDGGRIINI